MEKRVQNKARIYVQNLKEDIIKFVNTLDSIDSGDKNLLIQHIYDCKRLEYSKEDFSKRKRVKNVVPLFERCCALRANHEQCTRRRKGDSKYCGTHIKGIPHGELSDSPVENTITKKTVWGQDIMGIIYYIDDDNNVYDPQDIIKNKVNPQVIAKYIKNQDGTYSIPSFNNKKK